MNAFSISPRASALCLALAAAFPCAFAQTPALEETVVTATRFAEPAQSLPLGVSVITADEIQASGATTVNEAIIRLLGVPGRQDLLGGGDYSLDLRGFGVTADNNQVVVLDGIRLSEADSSSPRLAGIPIESIERIEVLRGSGAVLYGEGATGGVIVITTKAGAGRQQAMGGTLQGAVGSYGLRDARASATVTSANGFTLDTHAQKRRSDGYRANSASDSDAVSVGGQWSDDWLRLGARLAQDNLDARLPGALTAQQYAADPRQSTTPQDRASVRNDRASVFARAELGPWQLAFDAGHREKQLRSLSVFSFGESRFDYDVHANNYALRARHEGGLGSAKNALVLGADVGDWRREVLGAFGSTATQRSRAFYASDDVTLAGGTRLSLGARTERIEKDSTLSGTGFADREHAWGLGLSHTYARGVTVYARLGRSFRLPNVDEFNFTTPGLALLPQVSRDKELGARWAYGDGKLEARLYRSTLDHEIGFDPNAVGPSSMFGFNGANVNFDPTRRQGLELDASHALTRTLGLRVNAALRKATFRSGPYAGRDVPLVPRKTLSVRADWTPAARHRVSGGVNWVSSQHPDFNNACSMPAYTTVDVRYAYQWRQLELSLGVANLLDKKYFTQAFGCAAGSTTAIYPEAGRAVTAALRVRF